MFDWKIPGFICLLCTFECKHSWNNVLLRVQVWIFMNAFCNSVSTYRTGEHIVLIHTYISDYKYSLASASSCLHCLKYKFSQITTHSSLLALLGAHNTYTQHTSWSSKYTQHTSVWRWNHWTSRPSTCRTSRPRPLLLVLLSSFFSCLLLLHLARIMPLLHRQL